MNRYEYDLTKFINEQYKKGNQIISIGFDSCGAWEGCTGEIYFTNGTKVCISDNVTIFDVHKNQIKFQESEEDG